MFDFSYLSFAISMDCRSLAMKSVIPFAALVLVIAAHTAMGFDECKDAPAATATWNVSCNHYPLHGNDTSFGDCWIPSPPTANGVALFPSGTNLVIGVLQSFHLMSANTFIVAQGANVTLEGQGMQATGCFIVEGTLNLWSPSMTNASGTSPNADQGYLPDPNQPEGTDCSKLPVGFTPRICGPGLMRVKQGGSVTMRYYYSSLFITIVVDKGANITAMPYSFLWSNVTNNGNITVTEWVYMHGFLYNNGNARMATTVFDKWATKFVDSPPILIENRGQLAFTSSIQCTHALYEDASLPVKEQTGTYKAALINYGTVQYTRDAIGASQGFDVFNFGTVMWMSEYYGDNGMGWSSNGNFVNHGVFLASASSVYLGIYYSVGGTLETKDGGSFTFGNSATDPRTIKLCVLSKSELPPIQKAPERLPAPDIAAVAPKIEMRDGCWWYGSFCYQTPYLWRPLKLTAPPPRTEARSVNSKSLTNGVAIALARIIQEVALPTACTRRYSFSENSKIIGDGTGSVVTTLPVGVDGTLEVGAGGKWYAMTENGNPPVFGGGRVRVRQAGEMYLALDMEFSVDGRLQVDYGGLLAVPKHAKVMVSNHTIDIRKGGIFHVDGIFSTNEISKPVRHCGILRGKGKIKKSKEEDLDC